MTCRPTSNTAAQSAAVPFLDIANRSVLAGEQDNPQVLTGLSAVQIAGRLGYPASPAGWAIGGAASTIIVAIDQVPHGQAPATGAHG